MHVNFGHVGTLALAGGDASGCPGKTIMTIVGLLATVVVTVYVSKLANRAIKQQTHSETVRETPSQRAEPSLEPGLLTTLTVVVVAAMLVAGAVWAHGNEGRLAGLFGPPAAKLSETYDSHHQGEVLDHQPL